MKRKLICCLCGEVIEGWGNNPYGALNYYGKPIKWSNDDRCCDKCNEESVIPGRINLSIWRKIS